MKILIVDDAKTMRTIIKNVLKKLGFSEDNFLEAGDGEEALKILEEHPDEIKIIFLDWNMPKMNGFEFLKKVRANKKYDNIKIVMVTTETKKENVIAALKAGVNNYIAKPFTPQVLKQKLEQMGIKM
ncbi:response regulator [Caminibacter pacificus]|jgi:two-component system chemotaxis response regulator CheY